ncbi:methionine aminotransferase [Epilithonimonas ginsengisoli]|uniref:Methionine aminotransferase n=1 Tax=Epilithonimonas ginsengisoli TaxID=1245592 RepID=A0ABU4JHA2_9FLAO|nr:MULTISPECIES: methionine aminotransferase [Chryseobacterium group]MBV6880318.1 aminotransferase class I/II-fold pyridoxal phosphate-dependent enzyme [Epilithonimonas sp. FP105]MDW8549050.1 methionine aminotransferase [Epilithonimonas ginsengisoli]OAH74725.1 aminotransferase [Chryseobacterium sp. FP211-J200]
MALRLSPSKLPDVKTTIFTEMSLLAQQENAVNLSQGFPDYQADENLLKYLGDFAKEGYNQYAPLFGIKELREEISRKFSSQYQVDYHPDSEINITAGATQGIFTVISAFVEKDDEIIIFEPAYDCYEPAIILNGGIVKNVKMLYPDYKINWNEVKNLVSEKTKMIVINNPNNPSGKILKQNDIDELIKIVKDTNIIILSDEVYENITFDSKSHLTLAKYSELKERTFVVGSFGKLLHITGWKIGYILAPSELMNEFRKVHQYNVFCVNTPAQYSIAKYLQNIQNFSEISTFFEEKRNYLRSALSETPFELLDCEGTYFLSANFGSISDMQDKDFCYWLTKEYKVATIPFSAFYKDKTDEKVIRFCFAKKQETLDKAIEQLIKLK